MEAGISTTSSPRSPERVLTMLGLVGSGTVVGAVAGSVLTIPELAIPIFAGAGAIAGAAAALLVCFTR
jgi:hypothetical protein